MNASPPSDRILSTRQIIAILGLLGVLEFLYHYLEDLATGRSGTFAYRFIDEFTGIAGGFIAFPVFVAVIRRWPLSTEQWKRSVPVHFAILMAVSVGLTTWNWASRSAWYQLAGLGHYDYGRMAIRYPMEFANHIIIYTLIAVLVTVASQFRAARARELRTAQLEGDLAQAQLHNLRLQLNPHFLFNALNTIASVMYDAPERADRMLTGLSELLRLTLNASPAAEGTLQQEFEILERYLEIQRARFDHRLTVVTDADAEALRALVPQLLLQPLVENAVKHGVDAEGRASIAVSASREHGRLHLSVRDHGPGLRISQADALARGVGLSTTASRLTRLYGGEQSLTLGNADGGGFEVTIAIPFRAAG